MRTCLAGNPRFSTAAAKKGMAGFAEYEGLMSGCMFRRHDKRCGIQRDAVRRHPIKPDD
jgi:hypothetical protein